MPNTTNFNFPTPADTDLVKDGASAIRSLGNSIDTAFVDLKGGTTGQVLSKASNTDMDFTWVAQDDSNAIQNALLTTTGDTIYASAASTPARLGIGTTGQVLTVSAGGLPTWATSSSGGMTLISSTTLSGTTVTLSSIPQTYVDLYLVCRNYKPTNDNVQMNVRPGNDSNTRYRGLTTASANTDGSTATTFTNDTVEFAPRQDNGSADGLTTMVIKDYANTSTRKIFEILGLSNDPTTTSSFRFFNYVFFYNQTGAISSLTFYNSDSGTFNGGTLLLYGVK